MTNFEIIDPHERDQRVSKADDMPALPLPAPGIDFTVRRGTKADLPWVDAMQKADKEGLGFRFMAELEGHVKQGNLYIAELPPEQVAPGIKEVSLAELAKGADGYAMTGGGDSDSLPEADGQVPGAGAGSLLGAGAGVGYCIARDRYMKRDELGLIVQMCVARPWRRGYVAAHVLQRMWDAWPGGVKLCSCWCAQDLPANRFWEACGFRALAFRTGSRQTTFTKWNADGTSGGKVKAHRIHIYWQKRIRQGDNETSYWFPSETGGGSINESRLVFPIPPGSSWRDAKPAILPGVGALFDALRAEREAAERQAMRMIESTETKKARLTKEEKAAAKAAKDATKAEREAKRQEVAEREKTAAGFGGLRMGWNDAPVSQVPAEAEVEAQEAEAARADRAAAKSEKQALKKDAMRQAKAAAKRVNAKNDPALKAAARDLRDRWMDAVDQDPALLSLPHADGNNFRGRGYDVSRQLEHTPSAELTPQVKRVESGTTDAKRIAA